MGLRLARIASICWLATALACGGDPLSPEEQVRTALETMEQAAEEGDVSAFLSLP